MPAGPSPRRIEEVRIEKEQRTPRRSDCSESCRFGCTCSLSMKSGAPASTSRTFRRRLLATDDRGLRSVAGTSRAGGSQTSADQAGRRYVLRRWAIDDRRSHGRHRRHAPVGHTRPQVTRAAQTSCAGGSQTTAGQADSQYVPRRWPQATMVARPAVRFALAATHDHGSGGQPARFAPVGHRRTPAARRAGTLCAGWSQMATDHADSRYVLRHRATGHVGCASNTDVVRRRVIDERRLRERRVRFAPVGHRRPRIMRTAGTSCAGGSHTTTDQAGDGYVSRPWVTDERRSRGRRERCAPAGHRRPQDCRRKGPVSLVWVGNSQTQLLVIAHLFE